MEPLKKIGDKIAEEKSSKARTTRDKIEKTYTEEIILGICAPIGTDKSSVITEIENGLKRYGYEIEIISLSGLIKTYYKEIPEVSIGKTKTFLTLQHKINGGNYLRERFKNRSILAELAIKKINLDRGLSSSKDGTLPAIVDLESRRKAYIIDSLKNKEELLLFSSIYKDLFYSFSVLSPLEERKTMLLDKGLSFQEIDDLMKTDDFEINEFGQDVRNTFVEADFFIRSSKKNLEDLPDKIKRYLHIIFESDIVTPLKHEYAMYVAKSAAGNSACLSRQVGASIMNKDGVILSKGWNDVPKFGGNLYGEDDAHDERCTIKGFCSNDRQKDELTKSILEDIRKDTSFKELWSVNFDASLGKLEQLIRNSKVRDLIEFSRSVHAEMHAIIVGSQVSGSKISGSILFSTTYPCHNCARHIVVAGIEEVYYIEPYVKSLSMKLHGDALSEDEKDKGKVKILMYDGVAPRRYLEFFSKQRDRKDKKGNKTDDVTGFVNVRIPSYSFAIRVRVIIRRA